MKIGRRGMHGWVWTSQGWAKKPRRLRRARSAAKPTSRKKRRIRRISAAVPTPQRPAEAEAPQVASGRGRAGSAATPAPEAATPAPRSPRRVWSGKYDDLAKLAKDER
jgi:hypothetical protein